MITRDPIRDAMKLAGIKETLKDVGKDLIDHAQQEYDTQRSTLEELFPYIMIASKRMSARAISRWFSDEKNIPISAASVAKAIREQDRFCAQIHARARVGADWLAKRFDMDADDILANRDGVRGQKIGTPYNKWQMGSKEEQDQAQEIFNNGLAHLREWDELPEEIRKLCIEKCITNPKGK